MVGEIGIALTNLKPNGEVKVHGEIWHAECVEGEVSKGAKIIVTGMVNLKLIVKKI